MTEHYAAETPQILCFATECLVPKPPYNVLAETHFRDEAKKKNEFTVKTWERHAHKD